ncbi:MAG TPA: TIGR02391 family protein [Flavobacterium sp.]|jgi:uncharacterized protein (TIGR02391 family)|nr:TIGR02391 family protein [Flavobacterium sp.]HRA74132.1 TIGR02391 family protein [Flavobacterium sp.]
MQKDEGFWEYLHPKVYELAKQRFENGEFADAVLACLREANHIIKKYTLSKTGNEYDGAVLMTRAFSVNNPVIQFADITTETGRNIQQGYMKMFEGMIIGIRNPKSHENMYPDKVKTVHFLYQASFIFVKLDEFGVIEAVENLKQKGNHNN